MKASTKTLAVIASFFVTGAALGQYRAVILPLPQNYPWSVGHGASSTAFGGYSVAPGGTAGRDERALIWTATGPIDVTPANYHAARIRGSRDGEHVGSVSPSTQFYLPLAYVWNDNGTGTLLHPANYSTSEALGAGGGKQVGNVEASFFCSECGTTVDRHAGLWSGSAASFQRLHAPGYTYGRAVDTDGFTHVGSAYRAQTSELHAVLWVQTLSVIDLHPAGYERSSATAVDGKSQVGWGETPSGPGHALLWRGSAGSVIDLHPAGYQFSSAEAVGGGIQVGGGRTIQYGPDRALAWRGTAESVVDLHQFLPPGFRLGDSIADDIDRYGNIIGTCREDATSLPRSVVWLPTSRRRG